MKKIITVIAAVVIASIVVLGVSAESVLVGDVNRDGKITASDARTVLRYSAQLDEYDDDQLLIADADKNGKVTAADARMVLRVSARLEDSLGEVEIGSGEATDNVSTTAPTVTTTGSVSSDTELDTAIGMTITEFMSKYGAMLKDGTDDGSLMYHNDYITIVSDSSVTDKSVTAITVTGGEYTLCGLYVGMSESDVTTLLAESEWSVDSLGSSSYTYSNQDGLQLVISIKDSCVSAVELSVKKSSAGNSSASSAPETTTVEKTTVKVEETTQTATDVDVPTDELPVAVEAFLSGSFGLDGLIYNDDGTTSDVVLYSDKTNLRMSMETVFDTDPVNMSVFIFDVNGDNDIYLANDDTKEYCELNDYTLAFVGMSKSDFEFTFNFGDVDSLDVNYTVASLGGVMYDLYKATGTSSSTHIYMLDSEVKKIINYNSEGKVLSTIEVDEFYSELPDNCFSLDSYGKTTLTGLVGD